MSAARPQRTRTDGAPKLRIFNITLGLQHTLCLSGRPCYVFCLQCEMKTDCEEGSYGSTQLPSREHITTLDGLRGIAILLVLGIHFAYSGAIPEPPPRYLSLTHVLVFGWMAVDLFFVLSGFLITGILLDTPIFFQLFPVILCAQDSSYFSALLHGHAGGHLLNPGSFAPLVASTLHSEL